MSRIKGTYLFLASPERGLQERWLDPATGMVYYESTGDCISVSTPFASQQDGSWKSPGGYTFRADPPVIADWYVLRHVPEGVFCGERRPASTQCAGPFLENVARTKAVGAVKTHRGPDCKVSIVQIKQGDTYNKVTPATPEPTYNWS